MRNLQLLLFFLAMTALLLQSPLERAAGHSPGSTVRVSVSSAGIQADGPSSMPAISASGRFVAFVSEASNLVEGDSNSLPDIFVHDRLSGLTERVSLSSQGAQAEAASYAPSISGDGRYVAFYSAAGNLVDGDDNLLYDVFVRDRQAGSTRRLSLGQGGSDGNGISPSISADGRFVAFISTARLSSRDHNSTPDVYLHDLHTGATEWVTDSGEPQPYPNPYSDPWNPVVSAAGDFVAFTSEFWPVAGLVLRDRQAGRLEPLQVSCPPELNWDCAWLRARSISDDGRFVAFYNEVGGLGVYVYDRLTGQTENPGVGLDGGWEAGKSSAAAGSGDMRYVAFDSFSSNLVYGDANNQRDVFVRDRLRFQTSLVSLSSAGLPGNAASYAPAISTRGRFVAFISQADNLVPGDSNHQPDIFVRDRIGEMLYVVPRLYLPLVVR